MTAAVLRPFDQRRAPREPGAHARHQHERAVAQPPVRARVRQRERDRARRRVAEPVDVHDRPLVGDAELTDRVVDDPLVRLVRHVDVDLVDRPPALREHRLRRRDHHPRRELEHLAAVHLQHLLRVVELPRAAPGQQQVLAAAAVGAELEAEEAAALDRLHHDRAGAVAEEHERRAVVPVEDLREHVAADDERPLRETRREHPVGLRDRVHEAGAAGEQVVGGGVGAPERVGHQRGRGREHHVRRHRGADQEVDLARVDAGLGERLARGRQRDVGERLVLRRDAPLADPRPLDDPLVRRVDVLREVVVRHHPVGHVHAETGDPDPRAVRRADHPAPPRRSACRGPRARRRRAPSPCRGRSGRAPGRSRSAASASRRAATTRLKRQSSIPAKNAILPRFSSSTSTATAPVWAIASTISTPGITGRSGKWPGNHQSSSRTRYARDDALAGLELDHLVEQEERLAVRQDRLDLVAPERRRRRHPASLTPPAGAPGSAPQRRTRSPRRRAPARRASGAARSAGCGSVAGPSTRSTRRAPFDADDEGGRLARRRAAAARPRRPAPSARCASTRNGSSTRADRDPVGRRRPPRPRRTRRRAAFPSRFAPSQVTTCSPAPNAPVSGVATQWPSLRILTLTVERRPRAGRSARATSSRPSPFGVSAGAESAMRPRSRVIGHRHVDRRRASGGAAGDDVHHVRAVGQPAAVEDDRARARAPPGARLELGHRRAGRVDDADGDVRVGGERVGDRRRVRLPVAVRRDRRRRRGRAGQLERAAGAVAANVPAAGVAPARLDPPPRARRDRALRQPGPVDPRARARRSATSSTPAPSTTTADHGSAEESLAVSRVPPASSAARDGRIDLRQPERGDALRERRELRVERSPGQVVRLESR